MINVAAFDEVKAVTMPADRPRGIDTSHFQGPRIDWVAAKNAGTRFAFIKATEGSNGYVDSNFREDWPAIYKAGILIRGAYHYAVVTGDPVAQAQHFVATVRSAGKIGPGDFLILDAEDVYPSSRKVSKAAAAAFCMAWLDEVVRLTGLPRRRVIVYTGAWWWAPRAGNSDAPYLAGHPLWLSGYVAEARIYTQDLVGPWPTWRFWQFSSSGKVPGVNGRVDVNVFNGTYRGLWWLSGRPLRLFGRK